MTLPWESTAVHGATALLDSGHIVAKNSLPAIALWALVASGSVCVLSVICRCGLASRLACTLLHHRGQSRSRYVLWRAGCFFSSFLPTAVVLVILAVLADYTARRNIPAGGAGLVLAVAVAVVGSHVDRQVSAGYGSYWEKIHDSLRSALSTADITQEVGYPACQLTRYNSTHSLIRERDGRREAVNSVLGEPVCTRKRRCTGHGGKPH
jgi:hypothetical protein